MAMMREAEGLEREAETHRVRMHEAQAMSRRLTKKISALCKSGGGGVDEASLSSLLVVGDAEVTASSNGGSRSSLVDTSSSSSSSSAIRAGKLEDAACYKNPQYGTRMSCFNMGLTGACWWSASINHLLLLKVGVVVHVFAGTIPTAIGRKTELTELHVPLAPTPLLSSSSFSQFDMSVETRAA